MDSGIRRTLVVLVSVTAGASLVAWLTHYWAVNIPSHLPALTPRSFSANFNEIYWVGALSIAFIVLWRRAGRSKSSMPKPAVSTWGIGTAIYILWVLIDGFVRFPGDARALSACGPVVVISLSLVVWLRSNRSETARLLAVGFGLVMAALACTLILPGASMSASQLGGLWLLAPTLSVVAVCAACAQFRLHSSSVLRQVG